MRLFIILAAAAMIAMGGCASPTGSYLDPGPAVPPGQTLVVTPWRWERQGPATGELARLRAELRTPGDIATWLQANLEWRVDYDVYRFLAPAELLAARRGCCSAFARLWCDLLAAQGRRAVFVAVWGAESAHAYALFRDGDRWRLCSNQFLYGQDLGVERDAAIAAANAEFYGSGGWREFLVFDPESGVVTQQARNAVLAAPGAVAPDRLGFPVRR